MSKKVNMVYHWDANIKFHEINTAIDEIQNMCNNVLILYNAHAKGNPELTNLANLTYYLLWNYSKSLIAVKLLLSATSQNEQDFAKGQLCITINECIKLVIVTAWRGHREAVIAGERPFRQRAAARIAGDADVRRVDFGACQEIVERAAVVPHAPCPERVAEKIQLLAHHVVGAA